MKKEKIKKKNKKIYRYKSPGEKVFNLVEKIVNGNLKQKTLLYLGKELDNDLKFRLKSEALAFKSTLLFKLITTAQEEEMKKNIIEDSKTMEQINYYRAVLADRIILEQEINKWSKMDVPIPKTINVKNNNKNLTKIISN
jgi:hypothetical protein